MTESELIASFRKSPDQRTLDSLSVYFKFDANINNGSKVDTNLQYRAGIVKELIHNFSLKDILLIRKLFKEELPCDREIENHDNLYQLCYYLYSLGQMEDTFMLYDAKYNATNMDTALMLDSQCITVGHTADEVITYIEKQFKNDIVLAEKYSGLLAELNEIKNEPGYGGPKEYKTFLDSYFNVRDDATVAKENIIKKRKDREEQALTKAIVDLSIFIKAVSYFFFFLHFPRYGRSLLSFDPDSILKRQQANYYLVTAISFLIIAVIVANNYNVSFLLLWCAGFGLSYLFDIFYNKQRQIDDIKSDWPRNPHKLY